MQGLYSCVLVVISLTKTCNLGFVRSCIEGSYSRICGVALASCERVKMVMVVLSLFVCVWWGGDVGGWGGLGNIMGEATQRGSYM